MMDSPKPTKLRYQKPQAIDLGPVAPIIGASCAVGDIIGPGNCSPTGNNVEGPTGAPSHQEDKLDNNLFD